MDGLGQDDTTTGQAEWEIGRWNRAMGINAKDPHLKEVHCKSGTRVKPQHLDTFARLSIEYEIKQTSCIPLTSAQSIT